MPYKWESQKKKIPKEQWKSRKLNNEQKEEIKSLYGQLSQRQLAKKYNVSRRLIVFIGCPEKLEQNRQSFKLRQKTGKYYHKEKQRQYVSRLRLRKTSLNKKNLLI